MVGPLAPWFERYITINRLVPGKTYNYAKRGFKNLPVMDITMHRPKCTPDSWLYVTTPVPASLSKLSPADKLYVGSQTADRMFRGDGLKGSNFHHAQMRAGNGERNLEAFVRAGGKVDIHRASSAALREAVKKVDRLRCFSILLQQPTKHAGYWFEQAILALEPGQWAWNTQGAEDKAKNIVASLAGFISEG